MSAINKLTSALALYVGYQILTKKKYSGLKHQLIEEFGRSKTNIIDFLDKMDLYLTVPKNIDVDKNRIAIEDEIRKLKRRVNAIDTDKVAKQVTDLAATSADIVVDHINRIKKNK
ncbi:MAG: hypothetical protein LBV37_01425 [Mycoplasmataceae bacterium]|jgi:hypothetical protein|nr:hypothetical protein [Mycoplasmataceae bacterium]